MILIKRAPPFHESLLPNESEVRSEDQINKFNTGFCVRFMKPMNYRLCFSKDSFLVKTAKQKKKRGNGAPRDHGFCKITLLFKVLLRLSALYGSASQATCANIHGFRNAVHHYANALNICALTMESSPRNL